MASLCKSQQCCIERRGFRQELDSWRYKLIHCVGFESILEGLFGPGLLKDLSLFEDCEPTGVCDWSFDENCLFCCLRREKVKEHLAGFHKPISESSQENILKQEQAKIIRLEKQAEEFINAVFYKKDSPRISDPNIPLVAREIMQRMIRQFAAEYTSKNSSTQDSSQPNSTKNQSLPTPPSGQSSPAPATTQNPVLSKLLMADQDSPLDLTVKKPQSEEPCEQDGVLDLSTKKSPCSSSTHSSISPSTSNTIGNGTQDPGRKAIDPNNSTNLTLEKFLVKLCSHHQRQFIQVLNNLCTEELLLKSKSQSYSVSDIENGDVHDNGHPCSARKLNISLMELKKSASEVSLHSPRKALAKEAATSSIEVENCHTQIAQDLDEVIKAPVSPDFQKDSATSCILQNCIHSTDQPEETLAKNHIHVKTTEDEAECTKNSEVGSTGFLECGDLSPNNFFSSLLNNGQESPLNIPKVADKENTQYISPKQTRLDKDNNDCKVKQEHSLHTTVVKKLDNRLSYCDNKCENFQNLGDNLGSALHENTKHPKPVKCKSTPSVRENDYDKQCDVVYISNPVATECNIENQKSLVCPRTTARKSTRGYLFGGDCCELSTVRTLVRSTKVEEKATCALNIAEALIIPNGMISETLPSTDVVSMVHLEDKRVGNDTFNYLPENGTMIDVIPDTASCNHTDTHLDQIPHMMEQSVDSVSKSLIGVISLVHDDPAKAKFPRSRAENEMLPNGHSDEIAKRLDINAPVVYMDNSIAANDYEIRESDFATDSFIDATHSNISVNQGNSPVVSSLDVNITVSLENKPLLSACDTEMELPADERSPLKTAVEKSSTFKHTCVGPSGCSTSLPNGTDDKGLDMVLFASDCHSRLNNSETLLENCSVAMNTDSDITDVQEPLKQICSEPIQDYICKENSEEANLNCSSFLSNLQDGSEQTIKENISIINSEILEHLKEEQTVANLNKCSVEKNPTDDIELKSLETLQPLPEELNCSTPAHSVERGGSAKDIHNLFDTCAKTGRNSTVQLEVEAVSKRDTQQCDAVSSFRGKQNDTAEEPLEAKQKNVEKLIDVKLDTLDNHLTESKNMNDELLIPSKRRLKKPPAPSDRRLRSCESHVDSCPQNNTSLQIHICSLLSTSTTQRSVEFKTENNTQSNILTHSVLQADEREDGENYFGQTLNNQFAGGKPLLSQRILKPKCFSPSKISENIRICFEIGTNKRKVCFATESNEDCLTVEDKVSNSGSTRLKSACPFKVKKCNKRLSANASNSLSCPQSNIKHVALKTLTKHKIKFCKTKTLKELSGENVRRPSRLKKCEGCNAQSYDISLKTSELTGNDKDKQRPKFMDWCSEEENQERISNFNNKYTSIHKNWISLEKEAAHVTKSKNKADKLKEIWKTKKRARKSKNVREMPRNSPMQMLFMNSLKLSNVCRWFLETTETKSLVIVKKINTRIPEEHQLPIFPQQRHSKQSLYPHTLQAQRLKKHLKKFASVFPAHNDINTQNALAKLIENNIELEVPEDAVKRASNCKKVEAQIHTKKPTSARILRKYNNFRENLHRQSASVMNKKGESRANKTESKINHIQNIKSISKLSLQTITNSLTPKYAVTSEKQKAKKRPKDVSLIKHVVQPSKKRKIEAKQEVVKNIKRVNKNALATKNEVRKVKQIDFVSTTRAPKKLGAKAQVCKGAILKKRRTKTAIQKHLHKAQLNKCQTKSAKPRPIPSNLSRQRITRTSSSQLRKKEIHRKICTVSVNSKNKNAATRKQRSQTNSQTHRKR
ncbi:ligand-dependent corepressor isoform X2 [Mixophyes fleayi]|uniref:ligand-dependent corepressor isoform X2 n=1 Tax=Mixophyes fleayi TaxID=3061075 RepID=UPI003F4DC391